MKMSSKARYGLYTVVALSGRYGQQPVPVSELATCTGVTEKYLEQILALLKKDGIVEATRGSNGGYTLAAPPEQISVGRVLRCLEDDLKIVQCIGGTCKASCTCVSHNLWAKLYNNINEFLDGITLKQLSEDKI